MYENTEDLDRLKTSSLVLTVIFSQGEQNIHLISEAVLPTGRKFGRRTQKGPSKKMRGRKNQMLNLGKIFQEWIEYLSSFAAFTFPI
jgi:hypothetical protein